MNENARKWSFHAIKHGVWYGSIQYTLHIRWTSSAYQSIGVIACVQTQASPREEGSAQLRRKACYACFPDFRENNLCKKLYAKYAAARITNINKYDGV